MFRRFSPGDGLLPQEKARPPFAGTKQPPVELPLALVVPAMYAQAGIADQAVTGTVTPAMPAVPDLWHAPLPVESVPDSP